MEDATRLYARFQAHLNGLDPDAFESQLDAESGFNPAAVSPKGARGVAQFMPATGKQYGLNTIQDLHDPIKSVQAGAKYMADLKDQAGGDERAARVGYNAGPKAMKRYQAGGNIPAETQGYLAKIGDDDPEALYQKFQSQLGAASGQGDTAAPQGAGVPARPSPSQPVTKQTASFESINKLRAIQQVQSTPQRIAQNVATRSDQGFQSRPDPADQAAANFEVLKRSGDLAKLTYDEQLSLLKPLSDAGWEVGQDYIKPPVGARTPLWNWQLQSGQQATMQSQPQRPQLPSIVRKILEPTGLAPIAQYLYEPLAPTAQKVAQVGKAALTGKASEAVKGAYEMTLQPQVEQLKQAYQLWEQRGGGDNVDPEIAAHAVAGMLPFVGPIAASAGEQLGQGDIRGFSQSVLMLAVPEVLKAMKAGVPVEQAVKTATEHTRLALPPAPPEAELGPFTAGPEGITQTPIRPRGQVEPFVGTREAVAQQPRVPSPYRLSRNRQLPVEYPLPQEPLVEPETTQRPLGQMIANAPPVRLPIREGVTYEPKTDIQQKAEALIEQHGTDLSLSNARSVFPEVQGPTGEVDPKLLAEHGISLTDQAQQVQDVAFHQQLQNPDVKEVEFVVGGTSSGKTVGTVPSSDRLVYESHLSDPDALIGLIKEAETAGKKTYLTGVYRDPERAYRDAIKRYKSTGKVVPPDYAAQTHADFANNYQPFIDRLKAEGLATDVRTIDNSRGKTAMVETEPDRVKPLDQGQLQRVFQGILDESKLSAADRARFASGQQPDRGNAPVRGEGREAGEVPQEAPQAAGEAAKGLADEQAAQTPPSPQPTEGTRPSEAQAEPVAQVAPTSQQAGDVVGRITGRTDHPAESLPDLQDQLNAAGIPLAQQVDVLNRAGFNFKDTFQLGGIARALRAEAAGETLPTIQHQRFGKLMVVGKTADNNRLIVIDKDGQVRGTQNPLGLSGNKSIKAYRTADLEKLLTIPWADLGLESEAWPTKAQLDVLGKLTGKSYGPHLSDVPDDVLKAVFPEAYKRRLAGADFSPKAMDAMQDTAVNPVPEDAPQFIKDAFERQHTKQAQIEAGALKEFGSGGPATRDLIDAALIHGWQVYSNVKNFGAWGARMVEKFGEDIKPHLRAVWNQITMSGGQSPAEQAFDREVPPSEPNAAYANALKTPVGVPPGPTLPSRISIPADVPRHVLSKQGLIDIANVPKTLISSVNPHAILRQGIVFSLTEPVQTAKALGDMMRAYFASPAKYQELQRAMVGEPNFQLAKDAGVEFTGLYQGGPREESFLSEYASRLPHVRWARQAFETFLNSQRLNVFSKFADNLKAQGADPELDTKPFRDMAGFVNKATGRGEINWASTDAKDVANALIFSPRLIASRIQLLNPKTYITMEPAARKIAMTKMFQFAGTVGAAGALAKLLGAEVDDDPDSPDFLKVKTGDTRYDFSGGFQPYLRLAYRLPSAVYQQAASEGKPAPGKSAMDVIKSFARSKASPVAGTVYDFLSGVEYPTGKPFDPKDEAVKLLVPMIAEDGWKAYQDSGWKGVALESPAFLGLPTATYAPRSSRATSFGPRLPSPPRLPQFGLGR